MINPVALNTEDEVCKTVLNSIAGTSAMNAKNTAPNNVILFLTFFKYYAVGLPGLIPGIKPRFC